MSNCKDCKFWKRLINHMGECDMLDFEDGNETDIQCALDVFVHDDSGLYFTFMTGENFGCVSFQPKINLVVSES